MEDNIRKETVELLEEMCRLRDETMKYREEAHRDATRARHAMIAAQMETVYLPEEKKKWVTEGIPTPPGYYAYYGAGGNAYVLYHERSGKGEYNAYLAELELSGFTRHYTGEMGKLLYACYYNSAAVLNVTYASSDGVLRIVVEPRDEVVLPPLEPICDGTPKSVEPKLCLFGDHLYDCHDCGMGYIYRLHDGTFVVIDGGMYDPDELPICFFNRLREMNGEGKIVISAWFLTHAHHDHIRVFVRLADLFADQLDIRRVICNFPGYLMQLGSGHRGWCKNLVGSVDTALEKLSPRPQVIRAHTGQRFDFPGLSVDMFFTLDDFKHPFFPDNFNATSLIFRLTTAGQTYMFLGDADSTTNGILVERFGELLRSDIVQVAHHGFWGGTKEVYDTIAAPIVFWPCPLINPKNGHDRYCDPNWSPITREMVKNHAKAVFLQWKGTDILSLPVTGEEGITLASDTDEGHPE